MTVCRPVGTRFNDCYTKAKIKHPPSFMIGELCPVLEQLVFLPIGTTMNGVRNRKMLKDKLVIHMAIHECNIFMQNGISCHRSKLVSNFPKKKNIKRLYWPGNSADLHLIENL